MTAFATPKEVPKSENADIRTKGVGEMVGFTIRLKRARWVRARELALSEGCSLQALCELGLSTLFEKKGLEKL